MKFYTDIFTRTVSLESLLDAWDEFKVGKKHKPDVQMFERNLEDNLFALHDDLASKQYRHGEYSCFYIKDPKVRLIHKSIVRDRIVHHAVFKTLNAIFEPTFIFDSYSYREGKGTHRAVRRLQYFANMVQQAHGRCFVLKCDIRKFFHSIDHDILLGIIARRAKDVDMIDLVRILTESFPPEEANRERRGCPIGNLTSQLFANVYLNELDQSVKHQLKEKYYIRYTDDFVVVHHDPQYLWKLKNRIELFLQSRLRLELHPNKVSVRKYTQGIDFLGYVLLPHAQLVRTKTRRRMMKKIRERIGDFKSDKIPEEKLLQSIHSYFGVLSHANSYKIQQHIKHLIWSLLHSPDGS